KAVWISEIRERWAQLYDHETSLSAVKSKIDRIPHVLFLWVLDLFVLKPLDWAAPASQKINADAEALAAAVAGPDFTAAAMLRAEFTRFAVHSEFWREISMQSNFSPEPDPEAFDKRADFLRGAFSPKIVLEWVRTLPTSVMLAAQPVPSPLTRL